MNSARPIAVYGGAFDPPHLGHAEVIRQLSNLEQIESIVVMPSRRPPHKTPVVSYGHRVAMCELMLNAYGDSKASIFREDSVKGTTFTADVVQTLPGWGEQHYLLVIGIEEVAALGSWKTPERIFEHAGLIVIQRPGFAEFNRQRAADSLDVTPIVKERILSALSITVDVRFTMSSTGVREEFLRDKEYAQYFVPPDVRAYIRQHGLYERIAHE